LSNKELKNWSNKESAEAYGVDYWGPPYYKVGAQGDMEVRLGPEGKESFTSLYRIAREVQERGIDMPVLLRFPDIIRAQVERLNKAFLSKMKEYGYQGTYRGVFPIKVNQQQQVIEEVIEAGRGLNHGLEAGSKAELMIALAYVDSPETLIICNGYKDKEFIDLALQGIKLGLKVFLVVERPGELELILERSRTLQVKPYIGIRVKLSSTVGGKWSASGGDKSIFGLNASQMIDAIDLLKREKALEYLQLLHYHLGSQIPDIRSIRKAASEALRYYISLAQEGAPMGYMDIGGGLAVDYDGSQTNYAASRNYSLEEYCADVLDIVMEGTNKANLPHPTIVSESGRALIAYSSVLLFDVLDVNQLDYRDMPETLPQEASEPLKNLQEVNEKIHLKNLQEMYHDCIFYRDELRTRFLQGTVTLRERALGDQIFWKVINKITKLTKKLRFVPEELQGLEKTLSDVYYGNFSLFQSLPDNWAIDQLFPILPIHRLNEEPTEAAVIADITCDSDGKVDKFIGLYEDRPYLKFHTFKPGEEYIVGTFLVGAYQETLGDLHNLFGDTHVASIVLDENGRLMINKEVQGDTVADVLSYVEYNPKDLLRLFRDKAEKAVSQGILAPKDRKSVVSAYEDGLSGYTYFESE